MKSCQSVDLLGSFLRGKSIEFAPSLVMLHEKLALQLFIVRLVTVFSVMVTSEILEKVVVSSPSENVGI